MSAQEHRHEARRHRDLRQPEDGSDHAPRCPFLSVLGQRSARFADHTSVFPSTTRTSAASIATGCLPARHGLLGNTMAIDEGNGLVCLSVGKPDFRDRLHRETGRTLHMPTLAERVSQSGGTAIAISNVSPGAAYFLDPDGFGWVYNPAGSFGPGRRALPAEEGLAVAKGAEGDNAATERFCDEVLCRRAPPVALLWLLEPGYTRHHSPLGSPEHRQAIASADAERAPGRGDGGEARPEGRGHPVCCRLRSRHGNGRRDDHSTGRRSKPGSRVRRTRPRSSSRLTARRRCSTSPIRPALSSRK